MKAIRFRLTFILLFILLLFSFAIHSPRLLAQTPTPGSISGQIINQQGYPAAGAVIRVCPITATGNPCFPLSTLYADSGLTQQIPNPISTDAFGNYKAFLTSGVLYLEQVTVAGVTTPYTYYASPGGTGGSFTAAHDLTGSATSQEVVGILGTPLPTLSAGYLNWTGSAWQFSSGTAGNPGGLNTQFQYNLGGTAFGGSSLYTYNTVTGPAEQLPRVDARAVFTTLAPYNCANTYDPSGTLTSDCALDAAVTYANTQYQSTGVCPVVYLSQGTVNLQSPHTYTHSCSLITGDDKGKTYLKFTNPANFSASQPLVQFLGSINLNFGFAITQNQIKGDFQLTLAGTSLQGGNSFASVFHQGDIILIATKDGRTLVNRVHYLSGSTTLILSDTLPRGFNASVPDFTTVYDVQTTQLSNVGLENITIDGTALQQITQLAGCTRTSNVTTCTTATPHGFTGPTAAATFSGIRPVSTTNFFDTLNFVTATVIDATHLSYADNGANDTGTGGYVLSGVVNRVLMYYTNNSYYKNITYLGVGGDFASNYGYHNTFEGTIGDFSTNNGSYGNVSLVSESDSTVHGMRVSNPYSQAFGFLFTDSNNLTISDLIYEGAYAPGLCGTNLGCQGRAFKFHGTTNSNVSNIRIDRVQASGGILRFEGGSSGNVGTNVNITGGNDPLVTNASLAVANGGGGLVMSGTDNYNSFSNSHVGFVLGAQISDAPKVVAPAGLTFTDVNCPSAGSSICGGLTGTLSGTTYYEVSATGYDHEETLPSAEVSHTVSGGNNATIVTWTETTTCGGSDFAGFLIYADTVSGSEKLIGPNTVLSCASRSWTDLGRTVSPEGTQVPVTYNNTGTTGFTVSDSQIGPQRGCQSGGNNPPVILTGDYAKFTNNFVYQDSFVGVQNGANCYTEQGIILQSTDSTGTLTGDDISGNTISGISYPSNTAIGIFLNGPGTFTNLNVNWNSMIFPAGQTSQPIYRVGVTFLGGGFQCGNYGDMAAICPALAGVTQQAQNVPGDMACALAGDTTIAPYTVTGFTSTPTTITYNVTPGLNTNYYFTGVPIIAQGMTPSGGNIGNPGTPITSYTGNTVTVASNANPGTGSGFGTLNLACSNQTNNAVAATPFTFASNYVFPVNIWTANTIADVTANGYIFTPASAPSIGNISLFYATGINNYQMYSSPSSLSSIALDNSLTSGGGASLKWQMSSAATNFLATALTSFVLPSTATGHFLYNQNHNPFLVPSTLGTLTMQVYFSAATTGTAWLLNGFNVR